ncbi:MAG: hypothetical protein HFE62_02650 [Firmicutes bacterium]|nr:hypothetical protein [Bacillota bacterium]
MIGNLLNTEVETRTETGLREERIKQWTAENFPNPNMLINGDFKIWQRGTEFNYGYLGGYTADRWLSQTGGHVVKSENGIKFIGGSSYGDYQSMINIFEEEYDPEAIYTISVKIGGEVYTATGKPNVTIAGTEKVKSGVYYNPIQEVNRLYASIMVYQTSGEETEVEWVKLEKGSVATEFMSKNPALEWTACQRYYQVHSADNLSAAELRPPMRLESPKVKAATYGYGYDAEIYINKGTI